MGLIDSHAHLTFPELFGQVDEILLRCTQAGVDRVVTIGTDLADAKKAVELARRYPGRVHAAVGFHPHEAVKVGETDLTAMAILWDDDRVVAMGEMGLDYHCDFSDRPTQQAVFRRQLELAAGRDKPLIIHCREALDDVTAMLVDGGFEHRRVVFHCFTGTAEEAARIARNGWRVSFTGIVTFRGSTELQAIARVYPADQLMVETDSPYLSPVPVRGKKTNEPAHVAHIARFLAEFRGVSYEEFVETTSQNTREFFGL